MKRIEKHTFHNIYALTQLRMWLSLMFEWGTLVTRTLEDTLFPSFSVNNRLSVFIPFPSSVPPSAAFSFSPLSLWLWQHQRESSDLWPQQPTLNLAKEGEHPVLRLGGPQIGQSLLWQVSTLANNWSPVPCPVPQCDTEPKLFEARLKEPHNGESGGGGEAVRDKGEITLWDSY